MMPAAAPSPRSATRTLTAAARGDDTAAGRIDAAETAFASAAELAGAMRRGEAAYGEHEKRTGGADLGCPDWYAAHMVAEHAGTEL
jgi:hypothetical protein